MKWISVDDQLPEQDNNLCPFDWVLVCGENNDMFLVSFAQRRDNSWVIYEELGVHSCTGFYYMRPCDITHWMPIPTGP